MKNSPIYETVTPGSGLVHYTLDGEKTLCGVSITDVWFSTMWACDCSRCRGKRYRIAEAYRKAHDDDPNLTPE